jgi:hypothetical protein
LSVLSAMILINACYHGPILGPAIFSLRALGASPEWHCGQVNSGNESSSRSCQRNRAPQRTAIYRGWRVFGSPASANLDQPANCLGAGGLALLPLGPVFASHTLPRLFPATADRGRPDRGYGCVQFLGGACGSISDQAAGLSRAQAIQSLKALPATSCGNRADHPSRGIVGNQPEVKGNRTGDAHICRQSLHRRHAEQRRCAAGLL